MSAHQIPVFVGITGKRVLNSDAAENERLAGIVRARIETIYDRLDEELPHVTKVLLTGGAAGVDLIAARQALGLDGGKPRPLWLVAVVLPFAKDLFREDFEPAEWMLLEEVLANPRVRCLALPRLEDEPSQPQLGHPASDLLSRANADAEWQEFRRLHYEQLGLWIVDTANILLAVMQADEPAEKAGGTARVVACRRSGRPDDLARGVIERSAIPLAPRPDLVRPPQQYVWLINPTADSPEDGLPAIVLPPLVDQHATREAYEHPGLGADEGKRTAHLRDSLAAAKTIERLGAGEAPAAAAWPRETCPAAVLQGIRGAQHQVRRHTQWMSRWAFTVLGVLFVLAVLAFEIFAKFFHDSAYALSVYVVLLFLVLGLYYVARRKRWQPDAEDSRAVAELLRLQYAWWRAGLSARVDHFHLRGADQDLARVREAARNAIVWAKLAAEERCADENWLEVWRPHKPDAGRRRDWVGEQAEYFEAREEERETSARNFDVLSWMLFVTSFWLAVDLGLFLGWKLLGWEWLPHALDGVAVPIAAAGTWTVAAAVAVFLAAACAVWLLRACISETDTWETIVLTALLAFVVAAFLTLGARVAAELLAMLFPDYSAHHGLTREIFTSYLMVVAIVVLPAMAGAMRFVAEKRAYEAEALSYREALRWFQHADELLAQAPPGKGDQASDDRARGIVTELGILALRENEAWLKARRERPLTPVIGG
jgi:hypothetical protein